MATTPIVVFSGVAAARVASTSARRSRCGRSPQRHPVVESRQAGRQVDHLAGGIDDGERADDDPVGEVVTLAVPTPPWSPPATAPVPAPTAPVGTAPATSRRAAR